MSAKIDLYVPANSEHQGELSIEGNARIDGLFIGNIYCEGDITIGVQGRVKGNIQCVNAEISGTFEGNLQVFNRCILFSNAQFSGLLDTALAHLHEGCLFRGEVIIKGTSS